MKAKLFFLLCAILPIEVMMAETLSLTISQDCSQNGITIDFPFSGIDNGYTWVDLGLSVKWATCNIGATSPEGYGNYYAWGEVTTKSDYSWSTYKYCQGTMRTQTKYCTNSSYGTVDNRTTLELSDDAAYMNWGGNWRMPTDAEWTELREQCAWIWTTQNGVNGYKVMGTKEGYTSRYIFLPMSFYWSSSLSTSYWDSSKAFVVELYSDFVCRDDVKREYGETIRAVCQ